MKALITVMLLSWPASAMALFPDGKDPNWDICETDNDCIIAELAPCGEPRAFNREGVDVISWHKSLAEGMTSAQIKGACKNATFPTYVSVACINNHCILQEAK